MTFTWEPADLVSAGRSGDRLAAVYRCYATDGQLLYVGKAVDPDNRWAAHRSSGAWWVEHVATRTVEWHASEADALHAEGIAIIDERPLANKRRIPRSRRPYMKLRPAEPVGFDFGDVAPDADQLVDLFARADVLVGPPDDYYL